MYVSPPIVVFPILAVMIAGAVWLAPTQRQASQVTVALPEATYQSLALRGKAYAGANRRPLTVAQVIEQLAKTLEQDNEAAAN